MERWMECDVAANPKTQLSDFVLESCRLQAKKLKKKRVV
jgi:hypothetical protein